MLWHKCIWVKNNVSKSGKEIRSCTINSLIKIRTIFFKYLDVNLSNNYNFLLKLKNNEYEHFLL